MNKRGAETTIGTIVVVILAVVVLAVVIYGFSTGWNNLWERIKFFTPAAESIDAVITKCNTNGLAQLDTVFCCEKKSVIISDPKNPEKKTCKELKSEGYTRITYDIDCTDILETQACKTMLG
ncbi:hypothetical protein J4433_02890 [Candidatus Pacearchaeota archaeon]|nr:hypothetical protein [Candidatus Pacearchaeota archaeon]